MWTKYWFGRHRCMCAWRTMIFNTIEEEFVNPFRLCRNFPTLTNRSKWNRKLHYHANSAALLRKICLYFLFLLMIVMRDDANQRSFFFSSKHLQPQTHILSLSVCLSLSFFAIDLIEINQIDFKQYTNQRFGSFLLFYVCAPLLISIPMSMSQSNWEPIFFLVLPYLAHNISK